MSTAQTRIWDTITELETRLGRTPTHQEVLNEVGGSMSTVSKHFKTWRESQPESVRPLEDGMPEFFQSACQRLYEAFNEEFADKLAVAVEESNKKVAVANQAADEKLAETLGLRHELSNTLSDKSTLEQELARARQTILGLEKDLALQITAAKEAKLVSEQRAQTISSLETSLAHARDDTKAAMDDHKQAINALSLTHENNVSALNNKIALLEKQAADLSVELTESQTLLAVTQTKLDAASDKNADLQSLNKEVRESLLELQKRNSDQEARFNEQVEYSREQGHKIENLSSELKKCEASLREANSSLGKIMGDKTKK